MTFSWYIVLVNLLLFHSLVFCQPPNPSTSSSLVVSVTCTQLFPVILFIPFALISPSLNLFLLMTYTRTHFHKIMHN